MFEDVPGYWLRWCDQTGNWFLTDTEQAQAQLLQAARNLLATGMEIAQVAQILGLSEAQVQALESSH
jgi:predicted transposase YdaD